MRGREDEKEPIGQRNLEKNEKERVRGGGKEYDTERRQMKGEEINESKN